MYGRYGNNGNSEDSGERGDSGKGKDGLFGRENFDESPGRRKVTDYPEREGRGGMKNGQPAPSGLSPWLRVWIHPRQVTRDFLYSSNPLKNALLLALIAGIFNALNSASGRNAGDDMSAGGIAVSVVISGIVGGLATYYIVSWLLRLIGGWLGGTGSTKDMRVVSGRIYGMLGIMVGLLWIPELLIAGMENFTSLTPNLDESVGRSMLYLGLIMLELVFGVWSFIAILHATGEAHGFSAWKSLLLYVILFFAVLIVAFVLIFVVLTVFGVTLGVFGI
ncbi:Yip1 family protein [Saccharibacillus kuerlensis]|uniref:Yip1 domain-containing protein n=1 Tax=Saccharibacillus kuerlensis TaxID=459527 RepID=A0ABQ2KSZ6_9BACL|nr:Yip1 family protein [Saccharibacillus kuerlensis]GGN90723.1 hypothetical protein GCM10010969_01510 [Saccharibacillus kuerlensis]